jgi:TetR/AcrR family transcriptional repressor of nem operon
LLAHEGLPSRHAALAAPTDSDLLVGKLSSRPEEDAADGAETKARHHFPGKAELGEALIGRYAARFAEALEDIDASGGDARAKLAAYARIYGDVLRDKRMCLCGMLAADYDTLPEPMRYAVLHFFDANEAWLANVFEQGQAEGSIHLDGSPGDAAQALIGGLEGALLIARPYGEVARFEAAASQLLTGLAGAAQAKRASPRHP